VFLEPCCLRCTDELRRVGALKENVQLALNNNKKFVDSIIYLILEWPALIQALYLTPIAWVAAYATLPQVFLSSALQIMNIYWHMLDCTYSVSNEIVTTNLWVHRKALIQLSYAASLQGPILSTTNFFTWITTLNCLVIKNYELRHNPQIYTIFKY
jgi:hypothetical protein